MKLVKIIVEAGFSADLLEVSVSATGTMSRTPQTYTRNTAPPPPLPGRIERILTEARWLTLAVLALYLILIFATYSKGDPGWSHAASVARVQNWGGRLGAYMADLLLFIFGISAWWWCAL